MDNLTPKEIADEEMINQAFHELLNDYLATKHRKRVEIITKAFNFANQAHKGIKRRSGEPYIMPVSYTHLPCFYPFTNLNLLQASKKRNKYPI